MRKSEIWTEIKNTDSSRMAATRRALANCQKPTTTAKGHSTKGCDGANISNNNSDDSLLQGKYLNMLSIAVVVFTCDRKKSNKISDYYSHTKTTTHTYNAIKQNCCQWCGFDCGCCCLLFYFCYCYCCLCCSCLDPWSTFVDIVGIRSLCFMLPLLLYLVASFVNHMAG